MGTEEKPVIYQWLDEDGVHISDRLPVNGSLAHLRRLLEAGCTAGDYDLYCRYCRREWVGVKEDHFPDCPYVAAKAFVREGEARPRTEPH